MSLFNKIILCHFFLWPLLPFKWKFAKKKSELFYNKSLIIFIYFILNFLIFLTYFSFFLFSITLNHFKIFTILYNFNIYTIFHHFLFFELLKIFRHISLIFYFFTTFQHYPTFSQNISAPPFFDFSTIIHFLGYLNSLFHFDFSILFDLFTIFRHLQNFHHISPFFHDVAKIFNF